MTRDKFIERKDEIMESVYLILSTPLAFREILAEQLERQNAIERESKAHQIVERAVKKLIEQ